MNSLRLLLLKRWEKTDLFCPPQCVLPYPPVTNYMLFYSTLLCKKIARAPGGRKKFKLTELGGDRIDPKKLKMFPLKNIFST